MFRNARHRATNSLFAGLPIPIVFRTIAVQRAALPRRYMVGEFRELHMTSLLTAPLKIGIAAACLVGVAILIAVDLGNSKAARDPAPAVAPAPLAAPPPVLPAAPAPTAVLCPVAPAAPVAKKDAAKPSPSLKDAPVDCPAVTSSTAKASEDKPVVAEKKTEPPAAPPLSYTVVPGDTLYGISVKVFGTPRHYEKIYELNRDRIRDPNTLQVGINLKLPDVPRVGGSPIGTAPAPDGAR
jgi:nucleoid-associated protein YgaU